MKRIVVAVCMALLLIGGALPGFAQSRSGVRGKKPVPPVKTASHFYLVPTFGGFSFSSGDDFESGPLYGVRLGYQLEGKGLVDSIGIEGFGAVIDSRSRQDDAAAKGYLFRIDAIYNLRKGRLVPFLSLGAGWLSFHGATDSESRAVVAPGLGVKYARTNHLDLRADVRRPIPFDPEEEAGWEYTAGVSYLFGKVRTVTPPRPTDADGDGISDKLDKCPGTPRGVNVDRMGCPPDADRDRVPDHLDRCPDSPAGSKVDASGCPTDSDGDGVPDTEDRCPGTPPGIEVDDHGCVPRADSSHFR